MVKDGKERKTSHQILGKKSILVEGGESSNEGGMDEWP